MVFAMNHDDLIQCRNHEGCREHPVRIIAGLAKRSLQNSSALRIGAAGHDSILVNREAITGEGEGSVGDEHSSLTDGASDRPT